MLKMRFISSFSALLFSSSCLVNTVAAITKCHNSTFIPDAVLRVTQQNITQSCLPSKSNVLINGTSPGPELRLLEGKTYWIRVYNDMTDKNLTMHWHGLSIATSPFSDGTPLASQWPIPPSHFFDYELHISIGMAGTYFYHSHVGFQAVSASGPLIVDSQEPPPYHYDEEKIVFIQDTFSKDFSTIEKGLINNPLIWSGEAAAILVNGKGGGTANGTMCNASLSVIDVEPGKTYRLRFVGATALTFASLAIEGHEGLEVIEADGAYTQSVTTSYLQVASGQRYSVLLHALPSPSQQTYFIQLESRGRPTITRSFAILNYRPKSSSSFYPPLKPVLSLPNSTVGFLDYQIHPLYPSFDFPSASEVARTVTITVHQAVRGITIWLENHYPWTESFPQEPYLVSLYKDDGIEFPSMARAAQNGGLDPISRAFPAEIGEVVDIVLLNTGADSGGLDAHPWHAHGRHYWDLGAGNGSYDAMENEGKWAGKEPATRDTTMLYRYGASTGNGTVQGWRAWRLRITEPGVWMVHCHILQHMLMGMQTIWVMGNETEVLEKVPKPEVEGYLTYGGNVYGNESHWPTVVHYFDSWAENQ